MVNTIEGFEQEVLAFIRRVAGSACGRPEAEVKGNLALLALEVEDILSQAVEWQSAVDERWTRKNQREQEACTDL